MPDDHIIPDGEHWNVKEENGSVLSTHDSQAAAETAVKGWLRSNGGGKSFTHRNEGECSRVRNGEAV